MEEIGQHYLDELINQNMVQVKDMSYDGSLKNRHIHDVLRELSIRKAKEEIRLLLTSRDRNITKHARYIHEMKLLDSKESWKLLMKKAFIDNNEGKCPEDLYDIGRDVLRKRDGLPLAIFVGGGLLVDRIPSKSKNKYLRSLFFHGSGNDIDVKPSYWKSFELLKILNFEDFILNELPYTIGELTGLSTLCSSLKNLVCLKVRNIDMYPTSMDVLDTMCNRTKLKLEGKLTKLPDLPPNLSYLTLVHGELLHDPMPVLEKLPKLLGLKLDYAYKGQKMEVSKKGFPRLKVLILREMWYLETIQVGKGGGMPELKGLEIYACFRLMEGLSKEMRLITILLEE
ncbi:PREDICTED: probable disease resistance RPP8-like protein 2 [Erythranthe guttata]|uniref:probable disease resistance RPP8-like protein 2 n=1 Tax=Erythranthe guttata TaxID=4155 RepID=UPI00064DD802|nr:PREDICTED: probable disease resistance RPP8-like protein 2 [Erythranthe guttata]|eukprot:XP_012830046.1 PREDICTED: probable disease resistance RPP8-like protein 2 [Erythranthe guttata]